MSGHHPNPGTLTLAKESLAMSQKTGDKNFQRMAIGLMALTGLGTLLHAFHEIYRDLKPKRESGKPEPACQPPGPAEPREEPRNPRRDGGADRSWVHKARVGDRPAEGETLWAQDRRRQTQARRP